MSSIKFKQENGKELFFYSEYDVYDGITYFCAALVVCNFNSSQYDDFDDDWGDDKKTSNRAVLEKNLFKRVVKEHIDDCNGLMFMSDNSNGPAFKHLFPHVPKRAFVVLSPKGQHYKCTPSLSHVYTNLNHNSKVQHLTIVCERIVPPKAKTK